MTVIEFQTDHRKNQHKPISVLLWSVALSFILFSFFLDTPSQIISGVWQLIKHPDGLITDYVKVGGYGATFFNSGLIMSAAILLFQLCKVTLSGPSIACIFLMAGFSMFGKNIANIWPIIFGVYIYSLIQKENFSKYVYTALYGTALSPLITEVALGISSLPWKLFFCLLTGVIIGLVLPPLSSYCLRVHQGYNLYNVGFSAGLVGTALVSIMRSFGFHTQSSLVWTYENNFVVISYLYFLFTMFLVVGFFLIEDKKTISHFYRHSGRLMADFILMDGFPTVLFNMGSLGIFATSYILIIGGTINGATIGGILTIVGFGAFGKHLRNVTPVVLGVVIGSFLKIWGVADPGVQLAALFGTALAPISGQFGWVYGIIAGFLHSSMVLNIGVFHGGLNLYNNGFSAGLVALILVPIIEAFSGKKTENNTIEEGHKK